MTAGLVLLVGSAGALDCGAIPAGQAFVQAAFGLTLFGGSGFALRRPKRCRRGKQHNADAVQTDLKKPSSVLQTQMRAVIPNHPEFG